MIFDLRELASLSVTEQHNSWSAELTPAAWHGPPPNKESNCQILSPAQLKPTASTEQAALQREHHETHISKF